MIKCRSCDAEIPPEWKNAISKGECPGCGGEILMQEEKQLLDELSDAMSRMPNDPQGVAGWLISNYRFHKIGDAKPVEKFHTKQNKQQSDIDNIKVADNPAIKYLKNTDVYKNIVETQAKASEYAGKNKKIVEMARSIKELEDEEEQFEREELAHEDVDIEDEYISPQQGSKMSRALVTGERYVDPNVKPLSPEEIATITGSTPKYVSGVGGDDKNIDAKNPQARAVLNAQRMKRIESQNTVLGGGGLFKRSE